MSVTLAALMLCLIDAFHFYSYYKKNKINNKQLGAFIHEDSHLYVNHFGVIYNPFINIRL